MDPNTNNPPGIETVEFRDLGRIAYTPALELQRQLHEQVLQRERGPIVLLLEHDPVITVTPRETAAGHVLATEAMLAAARIERCDTDRGGDVTYHGPGQLIVYPILPLEDFGLNIRLYIRLLEQVVIDTVGEFGVEAMRDPAGVGVWVPGRGRLQPSPSEGEGRVRVDRENGAGAGEASEVVEPSDGPTLRGVGPSPQPSPLKGEGAGGMAKIAAIGVRIRRWVSLHGLALNVTTNLDHFGLIVPCGLAKPVTSLQRELGAACPTMERVKAAMIDAIRRRLRG